MAQETDDQKKLGIGIDELVTLLGTKEIELAALRRELGRLQQLVDTLALKPTVPEEVEMFGEVVFGGTTFADIGIDEGGSAPPPLIFGLWVDWDGDGSFANANANVTTYLLNLTCQRGRSNHYDPLQGYAEAGKLVATLDNRSGIFSSLNTASPLFGKLLPLRRVQWRTVFGNRWTGYVKNYTPAREGGLPVVQIEADGPFVQFARNKMNAPADAGSLTGAIINEILTAAGWPAALRNIDAGQSTTSRWFVADIDPMTALRQIEETELGFLLEDPDGNVVFQDRAHRRTGAHLVSQIIYSDEPRTPYPYIDIKQLDPLPYIVNDVTADVTPYTTQALQPLWTLVDVPTLAPGEQRTWIANYPSPTAPSILTVGGTNLQGAYVETWTTPVSGSDYTVSGVALSDLTVTVRKYATSMPITVKNNHATAAATLTLLRARGTPVTKGSATSVAASDGPITTPGTSQAKYGLASYRVPAQWLQNTAAAQDYANAIVGEHKDPRTQLELLFLANINGNVILSEFMTRQLSDRVTVVAGQDRNPLGINSDFFIEYLADKYDVQHNRYEVTMGLSQVGAEIPIVAYWILATSALDIDAVLGF